MGSSIAGKVLYNQRMAQTTEDPNRRVPQKPRALERYTRILNAAEALFAEMGVEAASVEEIARRTGSSIGTVYQYFANKEAIIQALAESYAQGLQALFASEQVDQAAVMETPALMRWLVGQLAAFNQQHRCFHRLLLESQADAGLGRALEPVSAGLADGLARIYRRRLPGLPPARHAAAAQVSAITLISTLASAAQRPDQERKTLIDEVVVLLGAYLGDLADQSS